jgi:predicted glycoside hydrolase/deacetylase ChbG (UPF0249 family)
MPAARKKIVVIHEDDVAMTHGANTAFLELSRLGTCSSGSVMVPCPWFPEAAAMAVANPDLDVGVHLTLTSEQVPYRWRPVTTPPASAGLTDELGYFWPDVPRARRAAPEAVEAELRAQVKLAKASGIDITHFDAHMGTAQTPEFVDIYRRLGHEFGVPVLLVKDLSRYNPTTYAGPLDPAGYDAAVRAARADGDIVFDLVLETPWSRTTDAETAYRALFASIEDGLTFLSMHFNAPPDFQAVSTESARIREGEYAVFRSGKVKEWIAEFGLEVVPMRGLKERLAGIGS